MNYVLDSSALIAYLRDEPGADTVEQQIVNAVAAGQTCFAHAVNLCEVFYDFHRSDGLVEAQTTLQNIKIMGIRTRRDFDESFCEEASILKAVHRRVSLADCFCLALTLRTGAMLLTADRHELEPLMRAEARFASSITFIR